MDGVLPGRMDGVLPGRMDGVLPGHMDGVLPGHLDGCLPRHASMCGHTMEDHQCQYANSSKLANPMIAKPHPDAPIQVPGQNLIQMPGKIWCIITASIPPP